MALTVNIDLGCQFDVKAKPAEVFDVLSDVAKSVSLSARGASSATPE